MKKILALSMFILSAGSAYASGAARTPVSFEGKYVHVSGTKLVFDARSDGGKFEVLCPNSVQSAFLAANSTLVLLDGAGERAFPDFSEINQGEAWDGRNFSSTYTTTSAVVYEEGYEIPSAPNPPSNPYNPSPVSPAPQKVTTYQYRFEQNKKGDYLLSTSSSKEACVYSKQ